MWKEFLRGWQDEVRYVCSLMPEDRYESEVDRLNAASVVLVRPPASAETVVSAERRLGTVLDEGLRSFYLESNGWYQYGFDANDLVVSSVQNIRLLRSYPVDFVNDVTEYFSGSDYGPGRIFFEKKYVESVLILSEISRDGLNKPRKLLACRLDRYRW